LSGNPGFATAPFPEERSSAAAAAMHFAAAEQDFSYTIFNSLSLSLSISLSLSLPFSPNCMQLVYKNPRHSDKPYDVGWRPQQQKVEEEEIGFSFSGKVHHPPLPPVWPLTQVGWCMTRLPLGNAWERE
jgi:hypothetical protein